MGARRRKAHKKIMAAWSSRNESADDLVEGLIELIPLSKLEKFVESYLLEEDEDEEDEDEEIVDDEAVQEDEEEEDDYPVAEGSDSDRDGDETEDKRAVKAAIRQAIAIQEWIDELPDRAHEKAGSFFESVSEGAAEMVKTLERTGRVSERQSSALDNWETGVKKWHPDFRDVN